MELRARRVTLMGLGRFGGGVTAARWLARQGALVTVADTADETSLAESISALKDVPIAAWRLGGHRDEDFCRADLVVVNPAVRPGNRFLTLARHAGVPLTSEIELFLTRCRARVIGVTGTNGKSTTAAMTASILRAAGRTAWLGGNIGVSLLEQLDEIQPSDWAVLELSSFQLWHLGSSARFPEIAVVTNCSPNHLDWHPGYDHYRAAKQRLLTEQPADGLAVLGPGDEELASWRPLARGRLLELVPEIEIPPLPAPGRHNRLNAVSAATAGLAAGCSWEAVRQGLTAFTPLEHRLQPVASIAGRHFYNDSKATTPGATIAALETLATAGRGGAWLLAGGSDKGSDFGDLAAAVVRRARGAALFGTVRETLLRNVLERDPRFPCTATETLDEALAWCWARSRPGDAIALSPACASHDQFRDYRHRGEHFASLVERLL